MSLSEQATYILQWITGHNRKLSIAYRGVRVCAMCINLLKRGNFKCFANALYLFILL